MSTEWHVELEESPGVWVMKQRLVTEFMSTQYAAWLNAKHGKNYRAREVQVSAAKEGGEG